MALVDLRRCSPFFRFIAFTAVLTLGFASATRAESDVSTSSPKDPRIGSLIETCKLTKVDPHAYLAETITKIVKRAVAPPPVFNCSLQP